MNRRNTIITILLLVTPIGFSAPAVAVEYKDYFAWFREQYTLQKDLLVDYYQKFDTQQGSSLKTRSPYAITENLSFKIGTPKIGKEPMRARATSSVGAQVKFGLRFIYTLN